MHVFGPPKQGRVFAIIAGSGFQDFADSGEAQTVDTEFGAPSSAIRRLHFAKHPVFLLLRHGDRHTIPPHAINYRANLLALRNLGVTDIVALNTVGVVIANVLPGSLAVPDQIIDYTHGRDHSIYSADSATLDHIDFTEPLDAMLRQELLRAARDVSIPLHAGGVYAVTQGPRLESAAEVDRLQRDGADFVGMTAMPEASLAMELEMRYACLSLIVNHAAGRGEAGKSIHQDIEASMAEARSNSMIILERFFNLA